MFNVGQTLEFNAVFTPPDNVSVVYVWEWWDGTVTVTTTSTTSKVLNLGGDPHNGRLLYYTVTAVLPDAQRITATATVEVNWPPQIRPSPTVTVNDAYFPYDTTIAVTAWDVEQDAFTFHYYQDGTLLGNGVDSPVGEFVAQYNGTTLVTNGTQNLFTRTIQSDQTINLYIIDVENGTRRLNFDFVGENAPAPTVSLSAQPSLVTTDASTLPDQRIGAHEAVDLVAYASDPGGGDLDFLWSFYGSNGWSANTFSTGTTTSLPNGVFENNYAKDISGETGGEKIVLLTVTNDTGVSSNQEISVTLVANQTGTTATLSAFQGNTQLVNGQTVAAGAVVEYRIAPSDPDLDVVTCLWTFVQPSPVEPATLKLWGPKVAVDTTGYASATVIQGTVRTFDRYGGTALFNIQPAISIA